MKNIIYALWLGLGLSMMKFGTINGLGTEERLVRDLLQDYRRDVRPAADPVVVTVTLQLTKLNELNTKAQYISVSGWVAQEWVDPRLAWDPEEYEEIEDFVTYATNVWLPDTTLDNSIGAYYDDTHYKYHRVAVYSDGTVIWEPGGIFASNCDIDVTYYPFDSQICTFVFANWAYKGSKVNLTFNEQTVETEMMESCTQNGAWDVLGVRARRQDRYYECCPDEPYSEVMFDIHLQRKYLYYLISIVSPSIMLSILVLFVFLLPPDAGEKVSMGVTLLLSFAVFLLLISENVPNTSLAVPLIQVYMIISMGSTCLSVCIAVVVLYLHHRENVSQPPAWLRHLAYDCMGRCLRTHSVPRDEDEKPITICNNGASATVAEENSTDPVPNVLSTADIPQGRHKEHLNEWKTIARICDRFFFWSFVSMFVVSSIIVLIVLPSFKPPKSLSD